MSDSPQKKKLRILIVDDVLKSSKIIDKSLRGYGFITGIAKNGNQALTMIE